LESGARPHPEQRSIKKLPPPAAPAEIEAILLNLLEKQGLERTVNPTDAARLVASGPDWHLQMPGVRRAAIKLALAGRLVIYRKGKPVDPNDFKGVYRLGRPRPD
jgi:hypothetical protein